MSLWGTNTLPKVPRTSYSSYIRNSAQVLFQDCLIAKRRTTKISFEEMFYQWLLLSFSKKAYSYMNTRQKVPSASNSGSLGFILVPSMWFWSVSWSTNCPVFFSFFWSTKKKLSSLRVNLVSLWWTKKVWDWTIFSLADPKEKCPVSGNFWSVSDEQKRSETGQFFLWLTKKNVK